MKGSNEILFGLGGVAAGYLLGKSNCTTCQPCPKVAAPAPLEGQIVSEVGDGLRPTYPYFKIVGSTKKPLTSAEYEKIIGENFTTPVTLVNKTFLDKYTTVGTIQQNNL